MAENIKWPPTVESFGEVIKNATKDGKLIVIFFFAKWSGKCQYVLDIIQRRLAGEHDDVDFIVVDVADMKELQIDWGIDSFPTFTLLKEERVVYQILGPYPDELGEAIGKLKKRTVYERFKLRDPSIIYWLTEVPSKKEDEEPAAHLDLTGSKAIEK